jgi:hypothetical protein
MIRSPIGATPGAQVGRLTTTSTSSGEAPGAALSSVARLMKNSMEPMTFATHIDAGEPVQRAAGPWQPAANARGARI